MVFWLTNFSNASAESHAGSYLSAIHAEKKFDFVSASQFYSNGLRIEPTNQKLLLGAIRSNISSGKFVKAKLYSKNLVKIGSDTPISSLMILADEIKNENFKKAKSLLEKPDQFNFFLKAILTGWVEIGSGNIEKGLDYFENSENAKRLGYISQNHLGLALALVGNFEKADLILSNTSNGASIDRRDMAIAHAQIMAQLGKNKEAVKMLDKFLVGNENNKMSKLRRAIDAGAPVSFDYLSSPKEGAALALYTIANAINKEDDYSLSLIYAQLVSHINNNNPKNILLISENLVKLKQYELAIENYAKIPLDHLQYNNAEVGRANALFIQGKEDAAIEVLKALTKANPSNLELQTTLGNTLRRSLKFSEAVNSYTKSISFLNEQNLESWFEYYARGICYERLGNWTLAEKDFRIALKIHPNQPSLLNYFGYSLVEKGIHLDEALQLIKRAVEKQPDDGYITDSLGWALYRLGKYSEAVIHMERAVELMPLDPIVNDHLGDVYWAVNRRNEARFQWHRALSFDPEKKDAERIYKKLDIGLDAVLIAEENLKASVNED